RDQEGQDLPAAVRQEPVPAAEPTDHHERQAWRIALLREVDADAKAFLLQAERIKNADILAGKRRKARQLCNQRIVFRSVAHHRVRSVRMNDFPGEGKLTQFSATSCGVRYNDERAA